MGFLGGSVVKNLPAKAEAVTDSGLTPGLGRPLEEERETTPLFLPGKFHGERSPRGHKESGMTEVT